MSNARILAAAFAASLAAMPAAALNVVVGSTGPSPAAQFLATGAAPFAQSAGEKIAVIERAPGAAVLAVQQCQADAAVLPSRELADGLVTEGDGTERIAVFSSDFVLVGPASDPAAAANASTAAKAYAAIAKKGSPVFTFPATQPMEMDIWRAATIDPRQGQGRWWREAADAEAALAGAKASGGYALVERGVFAQSPSREGLQIVSQGDPALVTTYHLVPVAQRRCMGAETEAAAGLGAWLRGPDGAAAIAAWTVNGEAPLSALPEGAD